jgi:hypothetical protein
MFDNGVVGFYSPFQGYSGCQSYYSYPFDSITQPTFSYMIAPLWTDLINYNGIFTTQGDSTFQRYNWENISQWGYPNNLNSFSLEIRPSGSISVEYRDINIVNYPISVGTTGDLTQGEYSQIFYREPGNITTKNDLYDWSTDFEIDECSINPLSSIECPGYAVSFILNNVDIFSEQTEEMEIVEDSIIVDEVAPLEELRQTDDISKPILNVVINRRIENLQNIETSDSQLYSDEMDFNSNPFSFNDNGQMVDLFQNISNVNQKNQNEINTYNLESIDEDQQYLIELSLSQDAILMSMTTSNHVLLSNDMQQILALGGDINQMLTSTPDFSKFDIKPPTSDEQNQVNRIDSALSELTEEELEMQFSQRIGSMDPTAQIILLQIMSYYPGFSQYGGIMRDRSDWYQDRIVYSNARVPVSNSILLFGAQDQRHQEFISSQYAR